jgi:putative glutamine amidotransferase
MTFQPSAAPLIGVTSCLKPRDGLHFHTVGDKYVEAVVQGAGGLPVLVPAIGERLSSDMLLDRLDGCWSPAARRTSTPRTTAGRRRATTTSPTRPATRPRCR